MWSDPKTMAARLAKQAALWLLLTVAVMVVVYSWRAMPAQATPSSAHQERQAKALESIAASLKKLEKCRCK